MPVIIVCLLIAALVGGYMFFITQRAEARPLRQRKAYQWLHGLMGAAGLGALLLTPIPAKALANMGLTWFRPGALVFLGMALIMGLMIVASARRGRRPASLMIGMHATVAIIGITLVLAIGSLA